jgi:hypothetical protein
MPDNAALCSARRLARIQFGLSSQTFYFITIPNIIPNIIRNIIPRKNNPVERQPGIFLV